MIHHSRQYRTWAVQDGVESDHGSRYNDGDDEDNELLTAHANSPMHCGVGRTEAFTTVAATRERFNIKRFAR